MSINSYTDESKGESIKISVNLVLQFEDKFPNFEILLDNIILQSSQAANKVLKNQNFNFQQILTPGPHQISIRYKETPEAMTNVEISGIAFDDIPVRLDYIDTHSIFYTDVPTFFDGHSVDFIKLYRHIGISGKWQFEFSTPLLFWRLEESPDEPLPRPQINPKRFATFVGQELKFVEPPKNRPKEDFSPLLDKIHSQRK
jgi:hypothetical protein